MTDRPIIFSAGMVNALLAGRKTQTRRVVRETLLPSVDGFLCVGRDKPTGRAIWETRKNGDPFYGVKAGNGLLDAHIHTPAVGDRLYVREHWKALDLYDGMAPRDMTGIEELQYLADGQTKNWFGADEAFQPGRHRQAMHMPRWASRLTLIVTDVRVEQVQDISEEDARAEGVATIHGERSFVWAFSDLWDSLHAAEPKRWQDNPWVVAVSFDVMRENIDHLTPTPQIERRR